MSVIIVLYKSVDFCPKNTILVKVPASPGLERVKLMLLERLLVSVKSTQLVEEAEGAVEVSEA